MVGDLRQGWTILAAMTVLFVVVAIAAMSCGAAGQPAAGRSSASTRRERPRQTGGNMEGKEARFGIADSALFATITTAASCGAVNAMHDSFTPLGGMVPLVLMQLGEVVFGGVGSGLYGMLVFADPGRLHRRPDDRPHAGIPGQEDRGARDEDDLHRHPRHAAAGAARHGHRGDERGRPRRHRQPRRRTASRRSSTRCRSAANNNGSAFAGLSANTPFYNVLLGVAMWFGRFGVIVPVLAIAGSLAAKKRIAGRRPARCRPTARCSSRC